MSWLKHAPPAGLNREEIIAATAGGQDSRYFTREDMERIERHAAENGVSVPSGKPATEYKVHEFAEAVGASEGIESRWVRVESTNGAFHGHPISYERFRKYLRKAQGVDAS